MDAETGLLPREFTYPGILLGWVFAFVAPTDTGATQLILRAYDVRTYLTVSELSLLDSVLGTLLGGGFFYMAWALYYLIRKRHGMGFGDIALAAMSGAFLGVKLTAFVLFTAPLLGTIYAITLIARHARATSSSQTIGGTAAAATASREMFRTGEFPFGVFLGACAFAAVFVGERTWRWYLTFFQ
jgi:leader peptidase (prepilin peptidase)/N-methyltransferase